jgi:hypothetical protein
MKRRKIMHSEMICQLGNIRRTEFISEAEAFQLAKQAQGQQPNRAQALLNTVAAFAKHVGAKSVETAQAVDVPQIELNGEQP